MKSGDNRITIELPKGLKLVAERNIDPEYQMKSMLASRLRTEFGTRT